VQILNRSSESTRTLEVEARDVPERLLGRGRRAGEATAYFPRSKVDDGWRCGGLLAHRPEVLWSGSPSNAVEAAELLGRVEALIRTRRRSGGEVDTGLIVLLSYEAITAPETIDHPVPAIQVLAVDRSIRLAASADRARLTARATLDRSAAAGLDTLRREFEPAPAETHDEDPGGVRVHGRVRTSLPRDAYLAAVERVRGHITEGDIYQANVCQRFSATCAGDPLAFWLDLSSRSASPRAAWVEADGMSLASISPEAFLTVEPDGRVETRPIKGTRARSHDPAEDRRAAESLLASAKDRAELLMIVDLERNDLGRVCRVGSVRATSVADLVSFSSVHHLVGRVEGRLRREVGFRELVEATFPGGSITGAPKLEAMRILRELEPVSRGPFTGSLIWAGDDGSLDSSILIRSPVFAGGRVYLGAGGGIVADSDAEAEWGESNHKARAAANALGFEPEEATR
jgi:para-aminobenzoate synthetase component 1